MRLDIHGVNLALAGPLRLHIERRLRFALGRFGRRVAEVLVRVADVNGPRGGPDKRCRIAVRLLPGRPVVVEDTDADLHVAVDRAADRAGRTVSREIARRREAAWRTT